MDRDAPYYHIAFYFEREPILLKRQNTERARLAMGKSTFGWLCMTLLCPQHQQD